MKVKMHRPEWNFGVDFLIYQPDRDGKIWYVASPINLILTEVKRGTRIEEPTLRFLDSEGTEFIQSFLDEAWRLGFRPAETNKTEKELNSILEATKYHLEDMRRLVFEGIPFHKKDEPILFKMID